MNVRSCQRAIKKFEREVEMARQAVRVLKLYYSEQRDDVDKR